MSDLPLSPTTEYQSASPARAPDDLTDGMILSYLRVTPQGVHRLNPSLLGKSRLLPGENATQEQLQRLFAGAQAGAALRDVARLGLEAEGDTDAE